MVVIPPIFASDGETEYSILYISLSKLAASSNMYIVVSMVIQFEISLLLSGNSVLFLMNLAWKNGQHSIGIHIWM